MEVIASARGLFAFQIRRCIKLGSQQLCLLCANMARRDITGRQEFITGKISGAQLACIRVQPCLGVCSQALRL